MSPVAELTRRSILVAGLASSSLAAAAQTAWPSGRRLVFEVWRGKQNIGRHALVFSGDDKTFTVAIDAAMTVGLGPIAFFQYRHQATETWRDGQFVSLQSHSTTNGKRDQVLAMREPGGVVIKTLAGTRTVARTALPLTHWNQHALAGPLFNPQTGAMMRESVSREEGPTSTRIALAGDANLTDWYDKSGVWMALRATASDGSVVDYRRA